MVLSMHMAASQLGAQFAVAVVDDDEASRDSLSCLLESLGAHAICFETGDLFLSSRDCTQYYCVILDVQMPGADGIEVTRRLRRDGFLGHILLVSGRFGPDMHHAGKAAGATAVFAKPLPESKLLAMFSDASGSELT